MILNIVILAIVAVALLIGSIKGFFGIIYDVVAWVVLVAAILFLTGVIGKLFIGSGISMKLATWADGWTASWGESFAGIGTYIANAIIYVVIAIILLIPFAILNRIIRKLLGKAKIVPRWINSILGALLTFTVVYAVIGGLFAIIQYLPLEVIPSELLTMYQYIDSSAVGKFVFNNNLFGKLFNSGYMKLDEIIALLNTYIPV